MQVNDTVKYAAPTSEAEAALRFVLTELNGDRCFIRLVCSLPFPPVQLAMVADLVRADD